MAGFKILLGIDSCKFCCQTFVFNHKCPVICDDIRNVDAERVRKVIGDTEIDVLVGGFPCEGFSMAGRRDPTDPRNTLFREFVRLAGDLKPKWILMENVSGLLVTKTAKGENVSEVIQGELRRIGYNVEYRILNAADYGVPQKRRRVFFLGNIMGKPIEWPKPTHAKAPTQTLLGKPLKKWVPVKTVLLPKESVDKRYFHSLRMIEGFRKRKERNIREGKGFGWQILRMEEPSFTISARYWKDGSEALVMYSPTEVRMLTELECARIQSFPDDYKFIGPRNEIYTQIGDAVPPLLARALARAIKRNL
jgi:DNA (cytosine-5)-methyltransferase 1